MPHPTKNALPEKTISVFLSALNARRGRESRQPRSVGVQKRKHNDNSNSSGNNNSNRNSNTNNSNNDNCNVNSSETTKPQSG